MRRTVCPRCHYSGNQHLCGCIDQIGKALVEGDLDKARSLYKALVDAANSDEKARRAA